MDPVILVLTVFIGVTWGLLVADFASRKSQREELDEVTKKLQGVHNEAVGKVGTLEDRIAALEMASVHKPKGVAGGFSTRGADPRRGA